jgi:predicted nucleic acid-binding Zn ribbon protein
MIRHGDEFEDDDDRDDPLPEDMDDDDDDSLPMMSCPACRASIVEDTQQCPYCGEWIMPESGGRKRSVALYIAIAIMLGIVLLWIFR